MDRRSWWATVHEVAKESDTTERTLTQLLCNVVLVSAVQQSESVAHIRIFPLF